VTRVGEKPSSGFDSSPGVGQMAASSSLSSDDLMASSVILGGVGGAQAMSEGFGNATLPVRVQLCAVKIFATPFQLVFPLSHRRSW
jgi:hypothetical protein